MLCFQAARLRGENRSVDFVQPETWVQIPLQFKPVALTPWAARFLESKIESCLLSLQRVKARVSILVAPQVEGWAAVCVL
jgi:hypothetical protein